MTTKLRTRQVAGIDFNTLKLELDDIKTYKQKVDSVLSQLSGIQSSLSAVEIESNANATSITVIHGDMAAIQAQITDLQTNGLGSVKTVNTIIDLPASAASDKLYVVLQDSSSNGLPCLYIFSGTWQKVSGGFSGGGGSSGGGGIGAGFLYRSAAGTRAYEQTVFTIPAYTIATNALLVFVNGVAVLGDYTETSSTQITFNYSIPVTHEVLVIGLTSGRVVNQLDQVVTGASTDNPVVIDIASIQALKFDVLQPTVLRFKPGAQDVIKTISTFNAVEASEFAPEPMAIFDGTVRPLTAHQFSIKDDGVLANGRQYSITLDLSKYKKIENIEVS